MADLLVLHLSSLLQSCINHKNLLSGRTLHARILRLSLSSNTFLFNRLVELYSSCNSPVQAAHVFKSTPNKTIFSYNAILSAHLKARDFRAARQLFDEMPVRNVVSWNMVVSALSRGGSEEEALDVCREMVREGFGMTRFTFASILSACGELRDLGSGRRFHGVALKVGLECNLFVENALVGMYAKCGGMEEAVRTFEGMGRANEVAFTALMGGFVESGRASDALGLFARMHRGGVQVDRVVVSAALGACARMDGSNSCGVMFVELVHCLLVKCGFDWDVHVGNSLIDVYAKWGYMEQAEFVFSTLPETNVVSWNVLINGYLQRGNTGKAMDLLQQMDELGFEPNDVTYMVQLSTYAKSRDLETAHKIFDKITEPNLNIWNNLLSAYSQQEEYEKTVELFREMQFSVIKPDRTTLAVTLSSCAGMGRLEFGKQVHAASTRLMFHFDMFVASGLVDLYSKCGRIEAARNVFSRMPDRDVVNWNSMMSGFALHSMSKEAFALFKEMRQNVIYPTHYTYASVISSCSGLASLAQGREVHALAEKDGFCSDVYVGSSLIDMYAKCGGIEEARKFFNGMPSKNIVSWNEMIHGYAQNGFGAEALQLYRDMLRTEQKPDSVTLIAALTACSHSGLVDDGLKIFYSMEKEHGIKPLADHYTCIIDALGRAARFEEVKVLIDKMPFANDPIIWEVLLSSCRVHSNASLGKVAAEHLFDLDSKNSATYVLLASIYGALGRWDDVSSVRKLMSDRGVVKDRGYSWTDHNDGVKAFMVDDDLQGSDNSFAISS